MKILHKEVKAIELLAPLIALIFIIAYIASAKQVTPFAEESVLYLANQNSSIIDATINAKDLNYFALPVHLLFRLNFITRGDSLYWARALGMIYVIYCAHRLSKLTFSSIYISEKQRKLFAALCYIITLVVIFSISGENLATFNIPYFYSLVALGQLLQKTIGMEEAESNRKTNQINTESVIDSLLMSLVTLSKPLLIPFIVSSLFYNLNLLQSSKKKILEYSNRKHWEFKIILYASGVTIFFLICSFLNILYSAKATMAIAAETGSEHHGMMNILVSLLCTYGISYYIDKWLNPKKRYSSNSTININFFAYKLQEYSFIFALPFSVYALAKMGRTPTFTREQLETIFLNRQTIGIGIVLCYITFKVIYTSCILKPKSTKKLLFTIKSNLLLGIFALIILVIPIVQQLKKSISNGTFMNFSSHIINNSASTYRQAMNKELNCYFPSPGLWGAGSKIPGSPTNTTCSIIPLNADLQDTPHKVSGMLENNGVINSIPNSFFLVHPYTTIPLKVKCMISDLDTGEVVYIGKKTIPSNQGNTALVLEQSSQISNKMKWECKLAKRSRKHTLKKFFLETRIILESKQLNS